jgi:hypothetical protein
VRTAAAVAVEVRIQLCALFVSVGPNLGKAEKGGCNNQSEAGMGDAMTDRLVQVSAEKEDCALLPSILFRNISVYRSQAGTAKSWG